MIWPRLKQGYLIRVEQTCFCKEKSAFYHYGRTIWTLRGGTGKLGWFEKYNIYPAKRLGAKKSRIFHFKSAFGEAYHTMHCWNFAHKHFATNHCKGWFLVSRYLRAFVRKIYVRNKTEAMHERLLVSVKVEPRSTSWSFKLSTFYLASILFKWLKFTCVDVRSQKRVSENQPLQ